MIDSIEHDLESQTTNNSNAGLVQLTDKQKAAIRTIRYVMAYFLILFLLKV